VRRIIRKVLSGIIKRNIKRLIMEYYRCERPGEGSGGRTEKRTLKGIKTRYRLLRE
jgi:hypothetical protein